MAFIDLLAGIEGMTVRTDVKFLVTRGGSGLDPVAAGAAAGRQAVFRVRRR